MPHTRPRRLPSFAPAILVAGVLVGLVTPLLTPGAARAEEPSLGASARLEPRSVAVGQRANLIVEIEIPPGFHLWSLDPGPGPLPLTLRVPEGALVFEGPWHGDPPVPRFDRGFERELSAWDASRVRLARRVRLDRAPKGPLILELRGQICTEENCHNEKLEVPLDLEVAEASPPPAALSGAPLRERPSSPGAANAAQAENAANARPANAEAPELGATATRGSSASGAAGADEKEGILKFLLTAFLLGFGALATPCVFPAIPLTVSFFSKYSEESFGRGARLAVVYALTMVGTFTGVGILVSIIFGVAEVNHFAAHPVFNLALGAALIFFALNLLGLFEIGVPGFVLGFVNRLEARYGRTAALSGEARRSGASDYVMVAVAAVTATTVFFTCTVAFVGIMLVRAAEGSWFWPTIGMLAFSSAFSLPFFLLAMFPQAARRLRGQSGNWLAATRVTLGFFELAASFKFLSNADLTWSLSLLSRDIVLALWVPLFALCGLYLLGKLNFGEGMVSEEGGKISVIRVLAATVVFGISLHLAVGLLNNRPFGSWIDGWLPPVAQTTSGVLAESARGAAPRHVFLTDLAEGRQKAREQGRLVFVNYTGYTCTNCRYMEGAMFPRAEVAPLLDPMVLVELYTDGGEAEHDANREDQLARFRTAALPFYSVECPNGAVLGTFASSTNDAAEFANFLKEASAERGRCDRPAEPSVATPALVLGARRLSDGTPGRGIAAGKWTLVNFWGTWCGPCVEELKEFLAAKGRELETRGGHFTLVAVEDDASLAKARAFMAELGVPEASALRVPFEYGPEVIDPRFELPGNLPFTVLASPEGEIAWRHAGRLTAAELDQKLGCFLAPDLKGSALALRTERCAGGGGRRE